MTQSQKSGGGRFLSNFNCFPVETYIRENKLKSDPAPEVGGGADSWAILIVFQMKSKFIWENKLKADPAPEVGGGGDS